jgi:DNA-binding beta-propeller fold protein YncE
MVYKDVALFSRPMGVAIDRHGTMYVSDSRMQRIYKITSDGTVAAYAGTGKEGADNAVDPLQASFSGPRGLAVGPNDELYVADCMNNAVRRIDATGVTTVVTDQRYVSGVAAGNDGAVYFSTIIKGQSCATAKSRSWRTSQATLAIGKGQRPKLACSLVKACSSKPIACSSSTPRITACVRSR